ncbi:PDR/VanB family oxidoreductase [Halomonas heilongjiangensis]|uniref:Oxidoreductase n=1 Tax=Halomonas heilongjiangensis TaxID=1387883 RepID=A0A2N7TGY6_9GAMM|nr:PDR/VanB family oxidoreductase [Halomonas heilongjiangensis]PMR67446.1 oxidoreductase [Halomonas heilongjiangensis]PXX87111.1 oxidoreductase [Halomonas heilongjiangensis]
MSGAPLSLIVEIKARHEEAQDIVTLELADPHGRPLPAFSAGAHIDVRVKEGVIRQYSLCNHPEERDRYLIGVLRDPTSRGGSVAMHEEFQVGDLVQISAPKNHFPLKPAGRTLLLAGGIGITPLLCMAERLAHLEADFALHYCTRSAERTAFRKRIAASGFAERVHFHFDDGAPEQKLDLEALLATPAPDTRVYVCGPTGFIEAVLSTAKAKGWPGERLHTEYFAGAVADTSDDDSFEVRIASSGASFTVPADKTVHQVLTENGIEVMVSCEQGVCGTCLTRVLEGEPDHRDLYLDDDEHAANDQFTPCCSRARSKVLVLDL